MSKNWKNEEDDGYEVEIPRPHLNQVEVLDSNARFKVLCCGRRFGKTRIAIIMVIKAILNGERVAYVTPEHGLGKEFFRELIGFLPKGLYEDNKSELRIEIKGGGWVQFFSGEALDNFRGRKFHLVIIDEAAKISSLDSDWGSAIRPTLMDYKGRALFISTPKGDNFFYRLYQKGLRGEGGFKSWHFTSYDNPTLPAGEVDDMKEGLTEAQIQEEIYAEPMSDGENPFGIRHIKDNTVNALSGEPTIIYGIDFGFTHDYTVIIGLDAHGQMTHFDRFKKSAPLTLQTIQDLPKDVPKVVDSTGMGVPLFQQLQASTPNIRGFTFTRDSKLSIINRLIHDVQNGYLKFNEVVAHEMMAFEAKALPSGHTRYEAKSGAHDDCIAALAIANHYRQRGDIRNWKLHFI